MQLLFTIIVVNIYFNNFRESAPIISAVIVNKWSGYTMNIYIYMCVCVCMCVYVCKYVNIRMDAA